MYTNEQIERLGINPQDIGVEEQTLNLEIVHSKWTDFQAKIKELNKKAKKCGVGELKLTTYKIHHKAFPYIDPDTDKVREQIVEVVPVKVVIPQTLKLEGWEFVGKIETIVNEDGTNYNILKTVGSEGFQYLRRENLRCDHCKTQRFRKIHYIVYNRENEDTLIVGSKCVKDFIGHNPNKVLKYFELLEEFKGLPQGSFFDEERKNTFDIKDVIRYTIQWTMGNGYISAKNADEFTEPTWKIINHLLEIDYKILPGRYFEPLVITEKAKDYAEKVYERFLEEYKDVEEGYDEIEDIDEFQYKIYLVMKTGEVPDEKAFVPLVIGAAYYKWKEITRAEKPDVETKHFGEVKKRYDLDVVLEDEQKVIQNDWGPKTIVKGYLCTQDGTPQYEYPIVWFASGDFDVRGGQRKIRGTIKDFTNHEKFGKQTVLNRVKFLDEEE